MSTAESPRYCGTATRRPLSPTEKSIILANMIRLADHHRKHCDGAICNISLSYLLELFRFADIELTPSDVEHFL